MKCEQKQLQAQIGTHHPLRDVSSKLLKDMKSMYQKCEKINYNEMDLEPLYRYLDLFIENEQQRSFLMDRFAEVVIYCGEKWFDER